METRVRFAPSNTGWLHVGGARTAIFNWLFAKNTGGKFLLRIEDTDRNRSKDEFTEEILESLKWLGIYPDENVVFQSKNISRHQELAEKLLKSKKAYRCFCTPEELEKQKEKSRINKTSYNYDRTCYKLSEEEIQDKLDHGLKYAVRFKMPDGETSFSDGGRTRTTNNKEIEDFVILRSNSTPTYQIAVVADDLNMGITHIIRGDDHLTNTFKQINLYRAIDKTPPQFFSVPLIYGPDKKKLSKKHGAVSITEYKKSGILPEPFFNFLTLLGWSPGDDREIFSVEDLIKVFSLERINPSPAVFDQKKLEWLNAGYISSMPENKLLEFVYEYNKDSDLIKIMSGFEQDYILQVITLIKTRLKSLVGIEQFIGYFFSDPEEYDPKTVKKRWKEKSPEIVKKMIPLFEELDNFTAGGIESVLQVFVEKEELKGGEIIHPLRLALSGMGAGPGLFEMMEVLGKETVLRRLNTALEKIK